jgi:hypothetical protein
MSHINTELIIDISKISVSIIGVNLDSENAGDLGNISSKINTDTVDCPIKFYYMYSP